MSPSASLIHASWLNPQDEDEGEVERPLKRQRLSDDDSDDQNANILIESTVPSRVSGHPQAFVQTGASRPGAVAVTNSTFESLGVAPWLIRSLATMEVKRPTEIQKSCIPEILSGRDCIGGSRTGTGKTIAFAVPVLQKWAEDPFGIYAVILTPTRELALQIFEQFSAIGAPHSLKSILVTGGSEMRPQATALASRPHVVVATPGRLADHIQNSGHDTIKGLLKAKVVVLDEADRLLAGGHGSMLPDVDMCLTALPPSTKRHTLLFTATVTPEVRALKELPRPSDRPPIFVTEISTESVSQIPTTLRQTYLQIPPHHKEAFLHTLLLTAGNSTQSTIVFCNKTKTADLLERIYLRLEQSVTSLHSNMPQWQRNHNLAQFRASGPRILIATDVAARGLDIPIVNLVVNYDLPRNPDDYIHRVGRTARAGRKGTSISLVGPRDVELLQAIEKRVEREMIAWTEDGVNVETRVLRGRTMKDVLEAKMEAQRDVEQNKDIKGRRRKVLKRVN